MLRKLAMVVLGIIGTLVLFPPIAVNPISVAQAAYLPNNYCMGNPNTTTVAINNSGSSAALRIVSGTSSLKTYICAINIGPVGGAVNVALVQGTTTTTPCDTNTAGLASGTSANSGWQFAANGGIAYGNGMALFAGPTNTDYDVCLFFSTGVQVSGVMTIVQM